MRWPRVFRRRRDAVDVTDVVRDPVVEVIFENGSGSRLDDCPACGRGRYLLAARYGFGGRYGSRLPESVFDVRDGVFCTCGEVIFGPRVAMLESDPPLLEVSRVAMSLAEIRANDPEFARIRTFEEMARDEEEGEARHWARVDAERNDSTTTTTTDGDGR